MSTVDSNPSGNKKRETLYRLVGALLTLMAIILLLGLVEGGVRVRQWWLYGSMGHLEEIKQYQPDLGIAVPQAGFTSQRLNINSLGFRGPELTQTKPPGRFRLAFLGGSTTYCSEASHDETTWPHLLWQDLQNHTPTIPMDYVNGGVTAYTTANSLVNLRQRIAPLQPDVIIIYHATNDMSHETRAIAQEQGLISKPATNSWLAQYSLFWFLVEKNLQIKWIQARKEHLNTFPENFGQPFEHSLTRLIQEAQQVARLVVVITWSQQMRPDHTPDENRRAAASAQFHMPFLTPEGLLAGFARYNAIIRRVARTTGAVLIEEENRIPGDPIHFNDSIHFTDAGSRVMADRVRDGLLRDARWKQTIHDFNQHQTKPTNSTRP